MEIQPPAANPPVRALTRRWWLTAALQGLISYTFSKIKHISRQPHNSRQA